MSAYGNVDWMLLMFDLACRELQNPLGEGMLFHGFLRKAASPTLWEPCWALNPVCTLAVGVGREHKLIWRKKWFVFQVETGIIHTKSWKQRFGAAMKIVLLLISKGASADVLLHLNCLQAPLLSGHFLASPWWSTPLWNPLQPLLSVAISNTNLKAVFSNLSNERRKRSS